MARKVFQNKMTNNFNRWVLRRLNLRGIKVVTYCVKMEYFHHKYFHHRIKNKYSYSMMFMWAPIKGPTSFILTFLKSVVSLSIFPKRDLNVSPLYNTDVTMKSTTLLTCKKGQNIKNDIIREKDGRRVEGWKGHSLIIRSKEYFADVPIFIYFSSCCLTYSFLYVKTS